MFYLTRTPWWLKKLYPGLVWQIPATEKVLYLSFDDGPHPVATPFVLDELKKYEARATFFCIGKNVEAYPHISMGGRWTTNVIWRMSGRLPGG